MKYSMTLVTLEYFGWSYDNCLSVFSAEISEKSKYWNILVTTIASVAFSGEKQNISFGQIGHKINWMGQRISGKYVNTNFSRGELRKVLDKIQWTIVFIPSREHQYLT